MAWDLVIFKIHCIEFTAVKSDTKLYERGTFSVENGLFKSRGLDLRAEPPSPPPPVSNFVEYLPVL